MVRGLELEEVLRRMPYVARGLEASAALREEWEKHGSFSRYLEREYTSIDENIPPGLRVVAWRDAAEAAPDALDLLDEFAAELHKRIRWRCSCNPGMEIPLEVVEDTDRDSRAHEAFWRELGERVRRLEARPCKHATKAIVDKFNALTLRIFDLCHSRGWGFVSPYETHAKKRRFWVERAEYKYYPFLNLWSPDWELLREKGEIRPVLRDSVSPDRPPAPETAWPYGLNVYDARWVLGGAETPKGRVTFSVKFSVYVYFHADELARAWRKRGWRGYPSFALATELRLRSGPDELELPDFEARLVCFDYLLPLKIGSRLPPPFGLPPEKRLTPEKEREIERELAEAWGKDVVERAKELLRERGYTWGE